MNFRLIIYNIWLQYSIVLTEGFHTKQGTMIHTVLDSVPLGDNFLSVFCHATHLQFYWIVDMHLYK